MSHNTIAHHEASRLGGVSPRWIGGLVLVLALGLGLGYLISHIDTGEESAMATISENMGFEEFVRLNTTDLDYLVVERGVVAAVDPFTEMNVNSYDGLIEGVLAPKAIAPGFWEMNTDLNYQPVQLSESEAAEAEARFWEMNVTSYEYPLQYSEPASGPR